MNEELRRYMDGLFVSAPQTKKAMELKEELLINMNEKYDDLLAEGYGNQEAYNIVIVGLGDVDELIHGIQPSPLDYAGVQQQRTKTAKVVSGCIGLYVLAMILGIALNDVIGDFSVLLMFLVAAGSTCVLIYHYMSRPKYKKEEETLVEEFKEWKSQDAQRKGIMSALHSILWTMIVALYFIVSFHFDNWHISWVIFLIGVILSQILRLAMDLVQSNKQQVPLSQQRKKLLGSVIGLIWSVTLVLYFLISFTFDNWHISWIIFLFAAAATSLARLLFWIRKD